LSVAGFTPGKSLGNTKRIDLNLRDWRLSGKTKLRKDDYHRDFYEEREG
jgi:hypothetical protein